MILTINSLFYSQPFILSLFTASIYTLDLVNLSFISLISQPFQVFKDFINILIVDDPILDRMGALVFLSFRLIDLLSINLSLLTFLSLPNLVDEHNEFRYFY
jgi:hypothetical protein